MNTSDTLVPSQGKREKRGCKEKAIIEAAKKKKDKFHHPGAGGSDVKNESGRSN